ncbi:MAG TPA: hypothetical protein EYN66_03360, partial [Myxococcales bacterium]|nr:hypothetical protein [Myxococcales bacterium]
AMKMLILRSLPLTLLFLSACATSQAAPPSADEAGFWRIMDTRAMGSHSFIKKHPQWDGRNAVIAVLDTGVDMGIAGLQKSSDGKIKVIEARDFTGQGEVTLFEAKTETIEGKKWLKSDEGKVRSYEKLSPQPIDGKWRLGFLLESRFQNSAVKDINLNASTNDKFAVLVAKTKKGFVAFVDRDGNGELTGAQAIQNYNEAQQSFTMALSDPKTMTPPLTFTLHIDDATNTVTFHFDDGGHGTHVAGIACGYGLMGRPGFNGIAPGAQILSLKIGDNTLSGGSTTSDSMRKAIEFAGEWTKKHKRAVIINMSYGIGSEIEGESDIDQALDDTLQKYPLLAAAVSAGNSGPGLSTVGTPAAAQLAVSAAAMLPKASAEAMFGSRIDQDKVFSFSSRGGEIAKPDLLAPGIASASVPRFDHRDIKGGTSMAAPQLAGAHALLVSAALANKTRFSGRTLKRALMDSAKPI